MNFHPAGSRANTSRRQNPGRIPTAAAAMLIAMLTIILMGCAGDAPPTETSVATPDAAATPAATVPSGEDAPEQPSEPTATAAPEPTPGHTATPTHLPRPTAAPTGEPGDGQTGETARPVSNIPEGDILAAAIQYFGLQTGQEPEITVESWQPVSWTDGSMGCPQTGYAYTRAPAPGYRIALEHEGRKLSVHTDETGRQIKLAVNCAETTATLWQPREPGASPITIPGPTEVPPEAIKVEPAGGTMVMSAQAPPVSMAAESADSMSKASAATSRASAVPQSGQPSHQWPPKHPRPPRTGKPDATFEAHARQPFVRASEDPVSTFSLDVDTTSYQLAVGWTRHGIRIDRDSVRAEEWVNALHYGYAPPDGDDEFALTSGLYPHPLGGDRRVARITAKAPETTGDAPLNVTLVLDASGSMAEGNRVAIARRAAETIRQSLDEKDRIAVVHFTTDVVRELTVEHTHPDAQKAGESINALIPRGSTNVQAGLNLGVKLAHQARTERPEARNYVILMSDGVANVDATNPFAILETAYDEDALNPLRLITIGVGISNYNDPLLETLAQYGNGWYRYLSSVHDAEDTFRKESWLALSTPFADQTRAQVAWNPETVARWRIIGYENRVTDDEAFTEDRKEFAEIHAGAETTIFYELDLNPRADADKTIDLGTIELRWLNPGTGESMSQSAPLTGRADTGYEGAEGNMALLGAATAVFADIYGTKPTGSRADREELWDLEMLADLLLYVEQESTQMKEHLDLLYGVINHMKPKGRKYQDCWWNEHGGYACPYPYQYCDDGGPGPCVEPGYPPQICISPSGPCHRDN